MKRSQRRKPRRKRFRGKLIGGLALAAVVAAFAVLVTWRVIRREARIDVEAILAAYREGVPPAGLTVTNPLDETLFPPDIAPPAFRWTDSRPEADAWVVTIEFEDDRGPMSFLCRDSVCCRH